ncbi:uncharacterized protein METZ01_LOCUS327890, partial [marine metagenome]
ICDIFVAILDKNTTYQPIQFA